MTRTLETTSVVSRLPKIEAHQPTSSLKFFGSNIANLRHLVNLGKWVLHYLFNGLIEEELRRDHQYRMSLMSSRQPNSLRKENSPPQIQLPTSPSAQHIVDINDDATLMLRAVNGNSQFAATPSLSIGIATPYHGTTNHLTHIQSHLTPMNEEGATLEKRQSHQSQHRRSTETSADYFSNDPQNFLDDHVKVPATPGEGPLEAAPQSPIDVDKEEKTKEIATLFGKKFRMNFPKKLGRSTAEAKPLVIDEKPEGSDKSEGKEDKVVEDNFFGVVQKIRNEYVEQQQDNAAYILSTSMCPSSPTETPLLQLPPSTTVIIQEDRPDSGGVEDLYRGTVGSLGQDADQIERTGPMWLGDLLLRVLLKKNWVFQATLTRHRTRYRSKKLQRSRSFCFLIKTNFQVSPAQMGKCQSKPKASSRGAKFSVGIRG